QTILASMGFGALNAYCMMLFCLLYIPCFATLATIRKESNSTAYMWKTAAFQLAVAWIITFAVFRIGRLCGLA
ncbi:MAG TPA: hypothetical protein DCP49_09005, partial [Erysipelotrichaceae bacterium]|nr:hypothetical protein [Erysipelotrichaceae bacterium]